MKAVLLSLLVCLPCLMWSQSSYEFCDPPVRVMLIGQVEDATTHAWYVNGDFVGNELIESIMLNDTGVYEVRLNASSKLCQANEIAFVKVISCSIFIPNAFTPNGDGINDIFEPKGINLMYEMTIYDRWGNIVYIGQSAWPGNDVSGVYTYKIEHNNKTYIGRVSLIQ